jgi:hypothetical protein
VLQESQTSWDTRFAHIAARIRACAAEMQAGAGRQQLFDLAEMLDKLASAYSEQSLTASTAAPKLLIYQRSCPTDFRLIHRAH